MDEANRQAEIHSLAEIGQHLFSQDLEVQAQLPAALASGARAAWQRDDDGDDDGDVETSAARTIRHEAGAVALIGLAVDERGAATEDGLVLVALDAWQIGTAFDAADRRGMLRLVQPPDQPA